MQKDIWFGKILKDVREKNINRCIIGQLNINSIRNKIHFLESEASKHQEILLISETNVFESFPSAQFFLEGFSRPYKSDRCVNGGDILLYVRNDFSSCLLTEHKLQDTLYAYITKKKWLFCSSNNPNKNIISRYLHCLNKCLHFCISQYDNIMLVGDLNVESSDLVLNDFCNVYSLFSHFKEPICPKNPLSIYRYISIIYRYFP